MSGELSILRLQTWVRSLTALVAERARRESEVEQRHRTETATCEREFSRTREDLETRHQRAVKAAEADFRAEQARIQEQFTTQQRRTRTARDVEREKILEKGQHSESTARRQMEEAIWAAETVYEAKEGQPEKERDKRCKELKATLGVLEGIDQEARAIMRRARQKAPAFEPLEAEIDDRSLEDAQRALDDHAVTARKQLNALAGIFLLRLFADIIPLVLVLLPPAAVVVLAGVTRGWRPDTPMLAGAGAALALGIGIMVWLYLIARSRTRSEYLALEAAVQSGRRAYEQARANADERQHHEEVQLITTRDRETREAKEKYEPILEEIDGRREHHLTRIRQKYPTLLKKLHLRRDQQLRENQRENEERASAQTEDYEQQRQALESQHAEQTQTIQAQYHQEWTALQTRWSEGVARARTEAETINAESERLFPAWAHPAWKGWTPGDTFAPAIRFGSIELDMEALPGGVSADERLDIGDPTRFALPAVLALPDQCSLLLRSGDEGRAEAVHWARTSPASCTWPTTTRRSSAARSGRRPAISSSAWLTSPSTWRTSSRSTCATSMRRSPSTTTRPARSPSPTASWWCATSPRTSATRPPGASPAFSPAAPGAVCTP
jgi:hypothetical protein